MNKKIGICAYFFIAFFCTTNMFAQCDNSCPQSACACTDASICLIGYAGANVIQDANNSCAFSITSSTSRTSNSCYGSHDSQLANCFDYPSCFGYCYEWDLYYQAIGSSTYTH